MSLVEAIKEMKEQLEKEEEVVADAPEEEETEKPAEEPEKEDASAEDKKEEVSPPAEEKLDDSGYARLRREAAAAKKRADDLEVEVAELRKKPTPEPTEEAAPSSEMDPEIKEVIMDKRLKSATEEFLDRENKYKRSNPEYGDVANEYGAAIARSIQIQNPRYSAQKIAEETQKTILTKAAHYLKEGFDPIEELYHEAKELGFKGESVRRKQEVEEVEIKPDMKKVAENRKKTTGMVASGGKSEQSLTKAAASELSVAEWSKLPTSEKRRLMSS